MSRAVQKIFISVILILGGSNAYGGIWSAPTSITELGAWGPWFGVVVKDTGAAVGCAGNGTKALDISSMTPTKKAQMALLMVAFAKGQKIAVYYDSCLSGVTIITNVRVISP